MAKSGLFDLEKHFAFYGAYHSNPVNIVIHTLFVWPILFTSLVLFYFTPSLLSPKFEFLRSGFYSLPLVFNFGFLFTLIYALFYICLDKKAGSLAALLCVACWVGASLLAHTLGFSLSWKDLITTIKPPDGCSVFTYELLAEDRPVGLTKEHVVLAAQLFCWTGQFLGHGIFEKRAPALLDNLVQALLMAPFFVLLEVLQIVFNYQPYPGFDASVKAKIEAEIKEWQEKKQKKIS